MNRFISFLLYILTSLALGSTFSLSTSAEEAISDDSSIDLNTLYTFQNKAFLKPATPLGNKSDDTLWKWFYVVVNENVEEQSSDENEQPEEKDDITEEDECNENFQSSSCSIVGINQDSPRLLNFSNFTYQYKKNADSHYSITLLKTVNNVFNSSLQSASLFIIFRNIRI